MKKLVLFTIFLLFASFALFADITFSAEGYGSTLEEAKEDAKANLAEMIFPVSVSSATETSVSDSVSGSASSYSSSYSRKSYSSVFGEFPGFECKLVDNKNGTYHVRTELVGDKTTLNYYLNKLLNEKSSVEELYKRFQALSGSSAIPKRDMLANVLICYYNYTNYYNIYLKLGGDLTDNLNITSVPSYSVVMTDYKSILDQVDDELDSKSTTASINDEINQRLENAKAQSEYEKSLKEAKEQEALSKQLQLISQLESVLLESSDEEETVAYTNDLGLTSFLSYIDVISSDNYKLAQIIETYENMRSEWKTTIMNSFSEEAAAIRNKAYPRSSKDSNGNPTTVAKANREAEVTALMKQKNDELEDVYAMIDDELCSEIQKRYDHYTNAFHLMEEKTFVLHSKNDDLSVSLNTSGVNDYDGANYCWYIDVSVGEPLKFSVNHISLLYSELTGNKIPTTMAGLRELESNPVYQKTVDTYTEVLATGNFESSISFTPKFYESGNYILCPLTNLTIKLKDGIIHSVSFTTKTARINLSLEKLNYSSYDWLETYEERVQRLKEEAEAAEKAKAEAEAAAKAAAEKATRIAAEAAAKKAAEEAEAAASVYDSISSETTEETASRLKEMAQTVASSVQVESSSSNTNASGASSSSTKSTKADSSKNPFAVNFKCDLGFGMTFGSVYDSRSKTSWGFSLGADLYIGNFFLGAVMDFTSLVTEQSEEDDALNVKRGNAFQFGIVPVVGFFFTDWIGMWVKTGFTKSGEMVVTPGLTLTFAGFSLSGGPVYNVTYKKWGGGFGISYIISFTDN